MLQAEGRGFETDEVNFFIYLIFSAALGPGFAQPLREMSNRKIIIFLGTKVRPVRRVDNLTAICEPTV
jgi:hypothetical protein